MRSEDIKTLLNLLEQNDFDVRELKTEAYNEISVRVGYHSNKTTDDIINSILRHIRSEKLLTKKTDTSIFMKIDECVARAKEMYKEDTR